MGGRALRKLIGAVIAAGLSLTPAVVSAQKGKPVVAIYEIDDTAGTGQAKTFSAMLETAIEGTNKFRVIERQHIGKLVNEQSGARAGIVTSNTPGRVGGFEGADFLIYGSITSLGAVKKGNIGSSLLAGMLSKGGGAADCSNTVATLGVDIKITDAKSGEVKYVTRINQTQKSATSCNGSAQIDAAQLLRSAADQVATGLVTSIYPIMIAAAQPDGNFMINYGEGALSPGEVLTVYAKGEAIRDPSTGEVIGNNETKLGYVRVTEVSARFSKAVAAAPFASAPAVGSILRPTIPADLAALNRPQKTKR